MSARILVVDDVLANAKLLEARLSAEYFEVVTAHAGPDALDICQRGLCDVVLLDVMMPGMDGIEVCRRLKADPRTAYVPVIMVTALDQPSDRVAALEAGADDFLTKPVSDVALITRVRNMARLKTLVDELSMRAATSTQVGLDAIVTIDAVGENGSILVVDDRSASSDRLRELLEPHHRVTVEADPQEALFKSADGDFDLAIISLDLKNYDGLRLCSQLRSLDRTRGVPILVLIGPGEEARLNRALDIGVNDYLLRPVDRNEMMARVKTQIRRKRYADKLRDNVQLTIEMAITDALTGLHNRAYLERHLAMMVEQAMARSKPMSVLLLDIDHFKAVNDSCGHDGGDQVLREFSQRIRRAVRGIDLACRLGGEEFVVAMPDTDAALAYVVGERIRQKIAGQRFVLADGRELGVTVSAGLSSLIRADDTPQSILKRADEALYRAKRAGRNRVVAAAA
jgi:two-component system cell cycle response regulator